MTARPLAAVDAHVHFWDLRRATYPWLEAEEWEEIRADYLPSQFAADLGGVDVEAFVHLEANVDPAVDPVEETAWLSSLVDANPRLPPMVCVGYADLRVPDLEDVLARHAEHDIFRGIRQELWDATDLLDDDAWRAGLRRVAEHDLTFDLMASPDQVELVCDVLQELPELRVVVDHLGVPALEDGKPERAWRDGMRRLSKEVPQSFLKISGLALIDPSWEPERMGRVVQEGLEIFGPERCMLGSNFPVDRPASSYERLWRAYDEFTAGLSDAERAAVHSGTARRVYRVPT